MCRLAYVGCSTHEPMPAQAVGPEVGLERHQLNTVMVAGYIEMV